MLGLGGRVDAIRTELADNGNTGINPCLDAGNAVLNGQATLGINAELFCNEQIAGRIGLGRIAVIGSADHIVMAHPVQNPAGAGGMQHGIEARMRA